MIQRIQTLYLIAIVLSNAILLATHTPSFDSERMSFKSMSDFFKAAYYIFPIVSTILAVVTLFLFKKRNVQILLNKLHLVVLLVFFGTAFYELFPNPFLAFSIKTTALLVAFANLIWLHFAQRGIKKDEALVKSADRLR